MDENPRRKFDQDQQIINDDNASDQDRQAARFRQLFWQVRYQPVRHSDRPADTFLALWANLQLDTTSRHWSFPKKQIMRDLKRVFDQPSLRDALAAAGPHGNMLLRDELNDSARLYFTTCKSDSNYSSVLFNLMRLKADQVAAKAASGAVNGILAPLLMIGEIPWRDDMIAAICSAYVEVFPDSAECLDKKIRELQPDLAEKVFHVRSRDIPAT